MKLTIKNWNNFPQRANQHFFNNPKFSNRTVLSANEYDSYYKFEMGFNGFIWNIKILRKGDFMPGWPVEIWVVNNSVGMHKKLVETNIVTYTLENINRFAEMCSGLVEDTYNHHKLALL